MIPSVKEREDRPCEPGCIMWNRMDNRCLAGYPDERKKAEDKKKVCRYHLKMEECLEIIQRELCNEIAGNPIPNWLYHRIKARYERKSTDLVEDDKEKGSEYYDGYCAALDWIKKQTEFPCERCKLTDCSHHGTEYNCAGDCQ
jgi:hypothetical protein